MKLPILVMIVVGVFAAVATGLKAYVDAKAEAGYADTLVAVARLGTTLVRQPGEPLLRLEDVLR